MSVSDDNSQEPQHGHNGVSSMHQSPEGETSTPVIKQESSEERMENHDYSKMMTNGPQRKRKKVNVACVYCRRSHMICDQGRPCQRCLKRNIGHLCHDEPTNGGRRSKRSTSATADRSSSSPGYSNLEETRANSSSAEKLSPLGIYRHQPINPGMMNFDATTPQQANPRSYPSAKPQGIAINQQPFFYSEHAGSEFNSLTEFLSMIDDTDMINSINLDNDPLLNKLTGLPGNNDPSATLNQMPPFEPAFENSLFAKTSSSPTVEKQTPAISAQVALPNSSVRAPQNLYEPFLSQPQVNPNVAQASTRSSGQPFVSDSARDKFFLTAADPTTEISPEERLKQVINAKLEAGLLKPYNYAKGYQRLQNYMDNHMAASSRQRILKPLSMFRPGFRAIAKALKDIDLILVEENFERMLLDYDRVFTSMAIPACLWRRTGEIYRGNKEFASLVEVSIDDLKNGKLTIYELMTEESSVNFWEKYGAIAFDNTQKAVMTSCNLRSKDGRKKRNCCFSFTIRRDKYNIPSCIVGNFIPIQ
ncbi:hypothetical protein KL941_003814 [Ogataea angusta]|nr:hypothetical protein KL941_003814 [Ogataea angusta]